jgi:hypothetical protein
VHDSASVERPRSPPPPQSSPTRGSPTILPTAAAINAHADPPHDPHPAHPTLPSPTGIIDPKLPLELELYPTHKRDPDAHGGLGSSRRTGCLAPADVPKMGSFSRRVTSTGEPAASRTALAGAHSPLRASPVPRDSCARAAVRRTPCAASAIGEGVEAESMALLALGCCTAAAALGATRAATGDSIKASGFGLWVAESLRRLGWPDDTVVFALATLPVIELRGAIPLGIGCTDPWLHRSSTIQSRESCFLYYGPRSRESWSWMRLLLPPERKTIQCFWTCESSTTALILSLHDPTGNKEEHQWQ